MKKPLCDIDIILNSLESGHLLIDSNLNVLFWNRWLSINTHILKDDILDKNLLEFYPHIDKDILVRKINTAFLLNTPTFYNANSKNSFLPIKRSRVSSSSLEMMQQQVTISPYNLKNSIVMISIYDISEIYETKLSLKKEIQKVNTLNSILESQQEVMDKNIMMVRTNIEGGIIDASSLFCEFHEYEKEDLVDKNISILCSKKLPKSIYQDMWGKILNKETWSGEFENTTKSGILKWAQVKINPILNNDGDIVEFSAFYHDITNKKLLEELYIRDPLTKIYNRAYFDKVMGNIVERQRKSDSSFALVMLDIDNFKSINDTYGHQVGDEALKSAASTLNKLIRGDDIAARWGGEEFIIMLKNISLDDALKISQKLRMAIENTKILDSITITGSFGVTLYKSGEDIKETFKRADEALYEAKNSGRNRVISR